MGLALTLSFPEYSRLVPLALGDVKPEGIDLTWVRGVRANMLALAIGDAKVQGGEHSLAQHLYRIAKGDRSHVGLPVFPLRNFGVRDIFVRRGAGPAKAADLVGARVGMYSWTASGSVWYRHLLRHLGVGVDKVKWTIGSIDEPSPATPPALPAGIVAAPAGRALSEMLAAGDLDAIISPQRPRGFDVARGPLARMFPDFPAIERRYFEATRCYPPQHLVILRRAAVEANPWILRNLQAMFEAAERSFVANQRMFPYASPWLEADVDATDVAMGPEYHAHGFEANRHQIDAFCAEAHALGLVPRKLAADELFAEFLKSG